jgi:hypothetical protein
MNGPDARESGMEWGCAGSSPHGLLEYDEQVAKETIEEVMEMEFVIQPMEIGTDMILFEDIHADGCTVNTVKECGCIHNTLPQCGCPQPKT